MFKLFLDSIQNKPIYILTKQSWKQSPWPLKLFWKPTIICLQLWPLLQMLISLENIPLGGHLIFPLNLIYKRINRPNLTNTNLKQFETYGNWISAFCWCVVSKGAMLHKCVRILSSRCFRWDIQLIWWARLDGLSNKVYNSSEYW